MPRRLAVVLAAAFIVICVVSPAAAQSRSIFWRKWDVTIDNVDTRNNLYDVAEYYSIDFSGTFSFGSAVIPYTNLEDIRNIQVYEGSTALRESCSESPGTFCAQRDGDNLSITYYFSQPISNRSAEFTIAYTVVGALRVYQDGDQLWWTAVPADHYGFSIGSSTITVQMPRGFAPREGVDPVKTYGAPADVNVQGTTITATSRGQLGGEDYFEIRVQYPHDPAARIPGWQGTFDQQRAYEETTRPLVALGLIALSVLLLIGGTMGVYALWYTRGRDPKVGPVPEFLTEPPTDLPPAVVGTLLDERADMRDVISTIIDLAHRGYIVMEETQTEGLFGMKNTTFTFKRTDKPTNDLRPFESRMVNALFSNGRMERSLDPLTNHFYTYVPQLQNDLYQALVSDGLFTNSPQTTRAGWSVLGGLLLAAAFVFGIFGAGLFEDISGAVACIPFALGAVGVLALIVGQHMPAKTRKGAEDAAKWSAFRQYLYNLDKYGSVEEAAQHFDDYLSFAVAFGIDRAWVRRFSHLQTVPVPTWYYPYWYGRGYVAGTPVRPPTFSGGGINPGDLARAPGQGGLDDISGGMSRGLESISDGLSNMLNSASRAMTSRPQQTGGGSGRWSSGGRSWSGGGFRGGGSSGGGSRGFG
ncbi:MAG: DUF2207 domain-containing protein [Anaerolineae bacterium]|nr:DUF2207 domain-containing protein [Anaerolineae bacterium]